jgi:hypothetical protein
LENSIDFYAVQFLAICIYWTLSILITLKRIQTTIGW